MSDQWAWSDHVPSGYDDTAGYGQVSCSCGWDSGDKLGWVEHIRAKGGDDLDAAWAEAGAAAEAAYGEPRYIAVAGPEPWRDVVGYRAECGPDFAVYGEPNPAAALRALAAKLRERAG